MKCPECVKVGKKSSVTVGRCTSTAAYSAPFYDEEGRLHRHDPNTYTRDFECSNGHAWRESTRRRCWCEADPDPVPE